MSRLLAAQATSPTTVRAALDAPAVLPVSAFTLASIEAPAVPLSVRSVTTDGATLLLGLDRRMTPDRTYELALAGCNDRAQFAGFRPARPAERDFDLWCMLPEHNRRDDTTGDLARFIACLQDVVDLLLAELDRWPEIFDLERAPAPFLELILSDLGSPFAFDLDELSKRRLASTLLEMYRQKGTAKGIRNAVRFFLGLEVTVTAFNAEGLTLGKSELGVDFVLNPADSFSRYAFCVEVGRILAPLERRHLRAIVNYLRPAHTHFVELVEPFPPALPDHWELGFSDLGDETVLH